MRPVDRYPLTPENATRVARMRLSRWRIYTVHETQRRVMRVWQGMTPAAYAATLADFENKAAYARAALQEVRRERRSYISEEYAKDLWQAQIELYKCQEEVRAVTAAMRLTLA